MGAQETGIGWLLDDNGQHITGYLVGQREEFVRVPVKKRGHFVDSRFPREGTSTAFHLGNNGWTHPYRFREPSQPYPALLAPRADVLPECHGLTIAEFTPVAARDVFLEGMKEKHRVACRYAAQPYLDWGIFGTCITLTFCHQPRSTQKGL